MGVMWRLFKKDLKAVTAFPRFEILLFISTFTFVGMSISSAPTGGCSGPISFIQSCIERYGPNSFVQRFNRNFSWFLSSFVFILAPLMATDVISGDYERGTLLTLVTYPVRRFEVLTSKFVATFLVSCVLTVTPFLCSIIAASSFNGIPVSSAMLLGYFAGMMLLSFILCSVSVAISVFSRRLLLAALAFAVISLCWGIALNGLAYFLNWSELTLYAYTETVRQLIGLIISPEGPFPMFSREQIVVAIAVQLLVSIMCLGIAYWFFERREFK